MDLARLLLVVDIIGIHALSDGFNIYFLKKFSDFMQKQAQKPS